MLNNSKLFGNSSLLFAAIAFVLAGCNTKPQEAPLPEVQVVEKLVPQRCIKQSEVPKAPLFLTGTTPYKPVEAPKVLIADFEAAKVYIRELEALLPPCLRNE